MSKTDLILRILSTLATLTIGIAASMLAYRQYKVSHTKLRFDLYEKRLALFLTFRQFVDELGDLENASPTGLRIAQFFNDSIEHRFLFDDPAITEYFELVRTKATELKTIVWLQEQEHREDGAIALKEREVELRTWFFVQPEDMLKLFQKHLSLRTLQ